MIHTLRLNLLNGRISKVIEVTSVCLKLHFKCLHE